MPHQGKQFFIDQGWQCANCDHEHEFDQNLCCSWDTIQTRICACGQKHSICDGYVEPIE